MVRAAWAALGHGAVTADIAEALRASDDICVIEGPPGAGKSWLARRIAAIWEQGGGSAVIAVGDVRHSDVALHPLGFAMAGLPSGWKSVMAPLADTAKAAESLLGPAKVISATVQAAAKLRRRNRRAKTMFLGDAEQAILFQLARLSRRRPLLLIADNLHWWDAESLDFLGRLRGDRMRDAFPFLTALRVLAAQTPEPHQRVCHPIAHAEFLRPSVTRSFAVQRPPRHKFADVLEAFGVVPAPSEEVADAVFSLSGGHLALVARCARRLTDGDEGDLLAAADSDEFIRRLLGERIRSLGDLGTGALALLQAAAVLGLTFRRDELVCLSDTDGTETARILRACRDEDILSLSDDVGSFSHDLYREYFLDLGAAQRTDIHIALADCLRRLRPGDYDLRCRNALKAERNREAATWSVVAALHRQREGLPWRELSQPVLRAMDQAGYIAIAEQFETALNYLNSYNFDLCLESLGRLPRKMPKPLVAEVDYLRAACLTTTRSEKDRAEARAILTGWLDYEDEEPEIGIRLMQLLLFGQSLVPDKTSALDLEARLRKSLFDRSNNDLAAEDALYVLDRCAGSLHLPERAVRQNRDAVEHFGPTDEEGVIRRPVEYFRGLVNLGANLLVCARYDEADEVHRKLEQLIAMYPPGTFPRLDYPRMNALLTEYRMEKIEAQNAAARQRRIVAQHRAAGDPFYVENALAVYLALSGDEAEAGAILDRLDAELASRGHPESSTVYLIRANRCAVRFVAGELEAARSAWAELAGVVTEIPYVTRPYLIRRHELLGDVMEGGERMSAQIFDRVLLERGPLEFGPLWMQFGRGFWLPEIEWWR